MLFSTQSSVLKAVYLYDYTIQHNTHTIFLIEFTNVNLHHIQHDVHRVRISLCVMCGWAEFVS